MTGLESYEDTKKYSVSTGNVTVPKIRTIFVLCTHVTASGHGKCTISGKVLHFFSKKEFRLSQIKFRKSLVHLTIKCCTLCSAMMHGKVFHHLFRHKCVLLYTNTTSWKEPALLDRPKIRQYHSIFPFTFPVYLQ